MRLKAPIVALTAATVLACGAGAWALTAAGQTPQGAAGHPIAMATRARVRPRPSRPSRPAGPVIETAGAPAGVLAKGAVLADASTGQVLWGRDPDTQRPMASVTKVMTALLVLESGDLSRQIRVPKAAQTYAWKYGGETAALYPGDVLTAQQLLEALLLASGADAAYTLANAYGPGLNAFVARMNATAASMGMAHTHFTSPDGLPYPTETSTYSTPADLLTLGLAAMRYPAFRSIVGPVLLPPAQGTRASPVLVGQHQRADRLLCGRRRHQDRVHRRRRALPALRGGQERPATARGRAGQPAHRPGGRGAGR